MAQEESTNMDQDAASAEPRPETPIGEQEKNARATRRSFLARTAKKVAYVSPVVLLIHPKVAAASASNPLT